MQPYMKETIRVENKACLLLMVHEEDFRKWKLEQD